MNLPDLDTLKSVAIKRGFRFETSPDGTEERMIRPDGTVAIVARRPADSMGAVEHRLSLLWHQPSQLAILTDIKDDA